MYRIGDKVTLTENGTTFVYKVTQVHRNGVHVKHNSFVEAYFNLGYIEPVKDMIKLLRG